MLNKPKPNLSIKPHEEIKSVFSEIPWEQYADRMSFTGKMPKNAKTLSRSITLDAEELRIAEVIKDAQHNNFKPFQTVSDILRDALRKGLAIDYEILVRRNGKIKHKGEASYILMAHIDEELAIIDLVEKIQFRAEKLLKEGTKNIAERDTSWAQQEINRLVDAAETDYPDKGIKDYFHKLLYEPQNADSMVFCMKQGKKYNSFR